MDRRQLLFGMTSLVVGSPGLNDLLTAQSVETANQSTGIDNRRLSNRETAGLRGQVKTCVEGSVKTEYDPAGRIISRRWSENVDGSETIGTSIEPWTYDGSGRLLKATSRDRDGSPAEQVNSYDENGRLLSITEASGNRTNFQYDEQGRKIEIRHLADKPAEAPGAVAVGLEVVFADVEGDSGFGPESAGNASSIKTTYNDRDQPAETQAYDSDGRLLSRLVRTHDEEGRITDVKTILEDPTSMFPAKAQADMIKESGVSPDEMRAQLKKVLGSLGESKKSYTYDSQGRITEAVLNYGVFPGNVSRTYTYNDHGDVAEERTTFTKSSSGLPVGVTFQADENGNLIPDTPPSEWPPQPDLPEPSEVHYTYQYDSHSNWTDKTVTHGEGSTFTIQRELSYY
jgi:YD repeat-containing protein